MGREWAADFPAGPEKVRGYGGALVPSVGKHARPTQGHQNHTRPPRPCDRADILQHASLRSCRLGAAEILPDLFCRWRAHVACKACMVLLNSCLRRYDIASAVFACRWLDSRR